MLQKAHSRPYFPYAFHPACLAFEADPSGKLADAFRRNAFVPGCRQQIAAALVALFQPSGQLLLPRLQVVQAWKDRRSERSALLL